MQRVGGIVEDVGTLITSVNTSVTTAATDVHELRLSVDKWLKVIAIATIGIGVAVLGFGLYGGSRRGRR